MNLAQLFRRALGADPEELVSRAGHLFHTRSLRAQSSTGFTELMRDGHLVSLGLGEFELPAGLLSGMSRWFTTPEKVAALKDHFRAHDIELELILNRADKLVGGKMPIFSHEPVEFSGSDRWRRDHILGVSAPQGFFADIPYLDSTIVGDSKHLWEPNRFGWVYWLGPAFLLTGDQKYFQCFAELTSDWFARNPYPFGVNYSSALEVAFRSYAWVWALDFFRAPLAQNPRLLSDLLRGIWIGCNHIEKNLSRHFAPNTHLTGEAFALFACGAALPEFAESRRWREIGAEILAQESENQFYEDGTHSELSSCYHLYSTDFYLQATLIARQCGFSIDPRVEQCAEELARRLVELAPGDLVLPQFNDCDGGRLTWFAFHPLDAAPALFAASELWPDLALAVKYRAARGYALWMTGCELRSPDSVTDSRVAPGYTYGLSGEEVIYGRCDSGIFTHSNDQGDFLLVRAGDFGYLDAGHSHDAPTALTLYFNGQPVIVDSGTGAYTQSLEIRNAFRGARGKNVLLLNERGPSEPNGWFTWNRKTTVKPLSARRFDGGFYLKARHQGFTEPCGFSVAVSREVIFLDLGLLIVIDSWEAERDVAPSLVYCIHPTLSINPDQRRLFEEDGAECHYLVQDSNPFPEGAPETEGESESESEIEIDGEGEGEGNGSTPDKAIPGQARAATVCYSPDYGVMGETEALDLSAAPSQSGAFISLFSRIGEVKRTGDSDIYTVGNDELLRELKVSVSGKISLGALKQGQKLSEGVEFAR